MAGGKEAPRQKMINMMYLVLTAMLALQVSNAILEKFLLINTSLEKFGGSIQLQNDNTVEAMKKAIAKSDKPENGIYLTKALAVRKESADLNAYIDDLKRLIIENAGGGTDKETGEIVNLAEDEKVTNMMVGPNKNGKGYELKKKLDDYIASLSKSFDPKGKLPGLALSAMEDPAFSKSTKKSITGKDFAELNFGQTPVPAALAMLSQKQTEVKGAEAETLDYLASLVNAKEYLKFDQMFAVVSAESKTVVAGQKYKAEVAIGAYSSAISPRISVNGSTVPVKDGRGQIEFIAQGGEYDKSGQLKKTYTANITFPKPDGSMQTVNREETYTVLKPTVQIETGTVPPLYFKCANRLQVTSPGLGQLFRPTFNGSGAEFLPGEGGKVTIVPNSNRVVLNVNNDGNLLQSFPFRVQLVPKPDLVIYVNGSPLGEDGERKGVAASSIRSIEVKALADNSFKNSNPEDANFRVSDITIVLAGGVRPKGKRDVQGSGANVSDLADKATAGDRYVISIKGCQRRNFKGEVLDVEIGNQTRTITLN